MAQYREGDRVRVKQGAAADALPDYIRNNTATVETVIAAADTEGASPQMYKVRVDRFPDHIYQAGMRRHHNLSEEWIEPAE